MALKDIFFLHMFWVRGIVIVCGAILIVVGQPTPEINEVKIESLKDQFAAHVYVEGHPGIIERISGVESRLVRLETNQNFMISLQKWILGIGVGLLIDGGWRMARSLRELRNNSSKPKS